VLLSAAYLWSQVEDTENEHIYHKELFTLTKMKKDEPHTLAFTIPLFEPLPPCYFVRAISNRWLGVETIVPLPLSELHLPTAQPAHTELLDLRPLPKTVLCDPNWEALFKFSHFNPIQTQVFHTVFHTDQNILVGSPTGSGKTVTAELAVLRLLRAHPGQHASAHHGAPPFPTGAPSAPSAPRHEGRVHRAAQGARARETR
jgi:activating signal cointegrator complex subunit 3